MKPLSGMPLILCSVALCLATFIFVLDYSIANVSIPYISGDLGVSNDQGTYVITSFAVGNAIALPMTGWLTKRFGAVRLLLIAILMFVIFSWLCGCSYSFPMLIVCRFLQGFCSGPLVPLSQSLLMVNYPPEKRALAMALWATIAIAGPVAGPVLGGWITFDYEWPWIFYINVPIGLLSFAVLFFILRKRETPLVKESLDWLGFILLAIGVSCLQILLDKGQQFDWMRSPWIRGFAVTSFVSFTLLIVWSLTRSKPLLELNLFKVRSFALSVFYIAIAYGIYFGSVVIVPLWLQTNMGYTSTWAGIAVAPIGFIPLVFSIWIGKLITRFGSMPLLFMCFILFFASCMCSAFLDTDVNLFIIGLTRLFFGCGIYFMITPLFALSTLEITEEKLPSATGIFHFVRALAGGIGTSIFTTLWIRRTAYHHQIIGENLTPYSQMTTQYLDQLSNVGIKGTQGLEMLNNTLNDQSAMLALNDCFWVMAWTFLGLIIFLPLGLKLRRSSTKTPAIASE